jgi:hypothetical protein
MAAQTIPVTNDTPATFQISLDDEIYTINLRWNFTDTAWYMDIIGINNTVDFKGLKLVSGVDIFFPLAITELGRLFVVDLEEKNKDPDYDLFGDRFQLIYVPKNETL